ISLRFTITFSISGFVKMNCTPKVRQKTFGVQFNLMGSPFSIPDVAYDYSSLVNDLNGNYDIEEVMKRAAIRTMNLWNEYTTVH
ncbi:hypothetical protein, partial [uncultured Duncaniella sp.]